MLQLLAHTFTPPPRKADQDAFAYMVADVVPAILACFEAGKWGGMRDGKAEGGVFLIGYAGRLFCVESDFQVAEPASGYHAIGCGDQLALGAMYALASQAPEVRLKSALEAAEAMSAGVCGPFQVMTLPGAVHG